MVRISHAAPILEFDALQLVEGSHLEECFSSCPFNLPEVGCSESEIKLLARLCVGFCLECEADFTEFLFRSNESC